MKKIFFTIIGIVALVSCDKKEVVQQEKAAVLEQKTEIPKIEVETISESNTPPKMGRERGYYARTEAQDHQSKYIALEDNDFLYMQINGALEKFNIPEPQEEEAPLDGQPLVEKFVNKNYEITIKTIEFGPDAGTISVKHLKSNATTAVDFLKYYAVYSH